MKFLKIVPQKLHQPKNEKNKPAEIYSFRKVFVNLEEMGKRNQSNRNVIYIQVGTVKCKLLRKYKEQEIKVQ